MTVTTVSHNRLRVGAWLTVLTGLLLACRKGVVAFQPSSLCHPRSAAAFSSSSSRLHFFLDNNNNNNNNNQGANENELAIFPKLASGNVKYNSLVDFVTKYAKKFQDDRKGMGLTTPVKLVPALEEEDSDTSDDVTKQDGVRLVFQSTQTGYKSKKEEDAPAATGQENKSQKKRKPPKQGGVEFRIQLLSNGDVQLKIRRSDVDEDTVVKEMSEEAIVSQIKSAVQAWRKEALST